MPYYLLVLKSKPATLCPPRSVVYDSIYLETGFVGIDGDDGGALRVMEVRRTAPCFNGTTALSAVDAFALQAVALSLQLLFPHTRYCVATTFQPIP